MTIQFNNNNVVHTNFNNEGCSSSEGSREIVDTFKIMIFGDKSAKIGEDYNNLFVNNPEPKILRSERFNCSLTAEFPNSTHVKVGIHCNPFKYESFAYEGSNATWTKYFGDAYIVSYSSDDSDPVNAVGRQMRYIPENAPVAIVENLGKHLDKAALLNLDHEIFQDHRMITFIQLNESSSDYEQDLSEAIETTIKAVAIEKKVFIPQKQRRVQCSIM